MLSIDEKARSLFLSALERGTGEWRAYLEEVCGRDTELRDRVDQLLQAHQALGSIHIGPGESPGPTVDHAPADSPGTQIGPYKLVEVIGEGGMGTVYLARQTEPVKRLVALKVIKAGMDSRQVLARFEAERQALALMDHPNIAKVFDGGMTGARGAGGSPAQKADGAGEPPAPREGRPYFVMELVKGVPITKFCDERKLTPRERLELFLPVCHAIQHAHQKGIIHRDIKPTNVLVALYDGKPVPKVIDFGVAKAAGQPLTEKTLVTSLGAVVGTPEYMSPEQAELNQLDIDTRSDVYSLGILLYELLTGTTPLTRKRMKDAALLEVLRVIREEEPQKPSTRLSTTDELPSIAANRNIEPARLARLVRGELDWIVMKALEKDRSRRYETANSFAMDVQRYLAGEAVLAVPPSAAYRLRKFARKNRTVLATVGTFVALLVVAAISSTALASWALRERNHADEQKRSAEVNLKRALDAVEQMLTRVGEVDLAQVPQMELVRRDLLQDALGFYQEFLRERGDSPLVRGEAARAYRRVGQIQDLLGKRDEAEQAYLEARALLETLISESPDNPTLANELAGVHGDLGLLYHATLRWPEAERSLQQGAALLEQLERAHPETPKHRRGLTAAHANLLNLLRQRGELDRAEAAYQKGQLLLDRLRDADPGNVDYIKIQAQIYQNVGLVFGAQGRVADAEAIYQKAMALNQRLISDQPNVVDHRRRQASTFNNLGVLYSRDGQHEKAKEAYQKSLALKEAIFRDHPKIVAFQVELAGAYGNMAMHVRRRSPEEALGWEARAISLVESVLEHDARSTDARMTLFNSLMGRAYALGRLNRHEEAAREWRRVLEVSEGQPHISMRLYRPFAHLRLGDHARATAESETVMADGQVRGPNLHMFATIYSLASAAAAKDTRLAPDAQAKLADQYGARAIELLQRARAAGHYQNPTRVVDLKEHKDFDAIRSRPDFQSLLEEVGRKSTPK